MICFWIACQTILFTINICRSSQTLERLALIQHLYSLDTSCYELGASWEKWCYDCTGLIWNYYKDSIAVWYMPATKLNTREMRGEVEYGELVEVKPWKARTWDFVLHTPIEWKSEKTHTAVFIRQVDENHIEILDTFKLKTRMSTRVVPYEWNIHHITIAKNPRVAD